MLPLVVELATMGIGEPMLVAEHEHAPTLKPQNPDLLITLITPALVLLRLLGLQTLAKARHSAKPQPSPLERRLPPTRCAPATLALTLSLRLALLRFPGTRGSDPKRFLLEAD